MDWAICAISLFISTPPPYDLGGPSTNTRSHSALNGALCVCVCTGNTLLKISKLISWNNLSVYAFHSLFLLLSFSLQPPLSKNIMESGPDIFS